MKYSLIVLALMTATAHAEPILEQRTAHAVDEWFNGIQAKDYPRALKVARLSWRKKQREPIAYLEIAHLPILRWSRSGPLPCGAAHWADSCNNYTVQAEVIGFDGQPKAMAADVMVVCEDMATHIPHPQGYCGVDANRAVLMPE